MPGTVVGSEIQRWIYKMYCMLRINLHSGVETEKDFIEEGHTGFNFKRCVGISRYTELKSTKKCSYKNLINM